MSIFPEMSNWRVLLQKQLSPFWFIFLNHVFSLTLGNINQRCWVVSVRYLNFFYIFINHVFFIAQSREYQSNRAGLFTWRVAFICFCKWTLIIISYIWLLCLFNFILNQSVFTPHVYERGVYLRSVWIQHLLDPACAHQPGACCDCKCESEYIWTNRLNNGTQQ